MNKNKTTVYISYLFIFLGIIVLAIWVFTPYIPKLSGTLGAIFLVIGAYYFRKFKDNETNI